MPPKPKKTKEQIEAEQKIRADEEKRKLDEAQRAAEEERKQIEQEQKLHQELLKRTRNEEKQLIESEIEDYKIGWERAVAIAEEREGKEQITDNWNKFINPTYNYDTDDVVDMNSLITTLDETNITNIDEAVTMVNNLALFIDRLESSKSKAIFDSKQATILTCNEMINKLLFASKRIIESSVSDFVRLSDTHVTDKGDIFKECSGDHGVSLGIWGNFEARMMRSKNLAFNCMQANMEIQKQVLQQNLIIYLLSVPYPYMTGAYNDGDYVLVNGCKRFELLKSSPTPNIIPIRNWSLRPVIIDSPELGQPSNLTYDTGLSSVSSSWTSANHASSPHTRRALMLPDCQTYPSTVATRLIFHLPESCWLSADYKVLYWDSASGNWSCDGISDLDYSSQDGSNRSVSVSVTRCGVFGLLHDRLTDLRLTSWKLIPIINYNQQSNGSLDYSERNCLFVINSVRLSIVIETRGHVCRLVSPVTGYNHEWMHPTVLLGLMSRRSGIHLLSSNRDLQRLGNSKVKNEILEAEAYKQISQLSSSFDIAHAESNTSLGVGGVSIRIRESSAYVGNQQSSAELTSQAADLSDSDSDCFPILCMMLEHDEYSTSYRNSPASGVIASPSVKASVVDSCSGKMKEGSLVHVSFMLALQTSTSSESCDRANRIDARYRKTVYQLLSNVRPLNLK